MGKTFLFAMGVACLVAGLRCHAGEAAPDSVLSPRKYARVTVGGEVMTDFVYRNDKNAGTDTDLELRRSNLRLAADVHPNVRAFFKLDFSDRDEVYGDPQLLAEAMLVMNSLGGTGLDVFAGQGRAPYGQDITLGMIQSYHHNANHVDSSEGRIYIIDPPRDAIPDPGDRRNVIGLPPARPGQIDRAVMAGAAYEWDERWRVEAAVFEPDDSIERLRLAGTPRSRETRNNLGAAARVWWRPVEDLTFEASIARAHSSAMGNAEARSDLPPAAQPRTSAWSMSLGFDWRPGPWRFFGEFQQAWDWGFTRDYDVTIAQLGAAREFLDKWRVGAMAEYMRIDDPMGKRTRDDYFKLTLNVKYAITEAAFIMIEYGHEKMRRDFEGSLFDKRRGDFFGARVGFMF